MGVRVLSLLLATPFRFLKQVFGSTLAKSISRNSLYFVWILSIQLFSVLPVALLIALTHPLKEIASNAFALSASNNS